MSQIASRHEVSLLENIRHSLQSWWQERREIARQLDEISSISDASLDEFARDSGISAQTLSAIIRRGAHATEEMDKLMRALNIDANSVRTDESALYRDMKVSCALCEEKSRCSRELATGTASENYTHFCPNHAEMSELRAHPEFQAD